MSILIFPGENNSQFENSFMMTPIKFKVSTKRGNKAQSVNSQAKTGDSIVLPTPSSGLSLTESGSWDETEGYQHGATAQGLKEAGTKVIVKKAVEAAGPAGKIINKGKFINDYASLAFQGTNFREFTFALTFIFLRMTNLAFFFANIRNVFNYNRFFFLFQLFIGAGCRFMSNCHLRTNKRSCLFTRLGYTDRSSLPDCRRLRGFGFHLLRKHKTCYKHKSKTYEDKRENNPCP